LRECAVEHGSVAESTVVRHRVGAQGGGDVHLASVTTSAGPIVIARLAAGMQPEPRRGRYRSYRRPRGLRPRGVECGCR
jgi:hypothetical protein